MQVFLSPQRVSSLHILMQKRKKKQSKVCNSNGNDITYALRGIQRSIIFLLSIIHHTWWEIPNHLSVMSSLAHVRGKVIRTKLTKTSLHTSYYFFLFFHKDKINNSSSDSFFTQLIQKSWNVNHQNAILIFLFWKQTCSGKKLVFFYDIQHFYFILWSRIALFKKIVSYLKIFFQFFKKKNAYYNWLNRQLPLNCVANTWCFLWE